jgi:hypothetical protein
LRKLFLHMKSKSTVIAPLFLLLIVSMATPGASANLSLPIVSVEPPTVTISAPGDSVMVEVNVTGVTNLYGYDLFVGYDNTTLEQNGISVIGPGQVVPVSSADYSFADISYSGMVIVNVGFLENPDHPPSFNGTGTLLWITFTGKAVGTSALKLNNTDVYPIYVSTLYNRNQDPIPSTLIDGEIQVMSEFPTAVMTPLLMISTLAAVLLAKIWLRKRRGPAVA